MIPVVAIIAPGAMGAAVGKRLRAYRVRVLTSLAGRSEATAARAREAGMVGDVDGVNALDQPCQPLQMPIVQAAGRTQR